MASRSLGIILPHLRRLLAGDADGPGDAQLLGDFLRRRKDGDKEVVSWYSTVKVWDAATGKEVASLGELKNSLARRKKGLNPPDVTPRSENPGVQR